MNFLEETKTAITDSGHTPDDIVFIGSEESGHSCTWNEFQALADCHYDSGYGAAEVAEDLIILFCDGHRMWRGEYDGSEWWEYSAPFKEPKETKPIKKLFANGVGWECLADIHGENN